MFLLVYRPEKKITVNFFLRTESKNDKMVIRLQLMENYSRI